MEPELATKSEQGPEVLGQVLLAPEPHVMVTPFCVNQSPTAPKAPLRPVQETPLILDCVNVSVVEDGTLLICHVPKNWEPFVQPESDPDPVPVMVMSPFVTKALGTEGGKRHGHVS